jgi:hypothetical protein
MASRDTPHLVALVRAEPASNAATSSHAPERTQRRRPPFTGHNGIAVMRRKLDEKAPAPRLADGPVQPVSKTLVSDLSDVAGCPGWTTSKASPSVRASPDGRRTVVLVSDDNFASRQVTQFIAFAADGI